MNKAFPYLVGAVVLLLLVFLMSSTRGKPVRRMDERVTLKQKDKIPYGTRVAKEFLPSLFPFAATPFDVAYPGNWDSIEKDGKNQAVILIGDYLDAEKDELEELSEFVEKGNYVFLISRSASDAVANFFNLSYRSDYYSSPRDSLRVRLVQPVYKSDSVYTYPGRKYESSFYSLDTGYAAVLGRNDKGAPNFIQVNKGRGSFFLHSSPLAFSNYFILHKSNVRYYQNIFSVLPRNVSTVLWNEYYLLKPYNPADEKAPNWLRTLFSYPAFKWGLLVAGITLALFVLLGMRRQQRMIPPHEKPTNESLDFVKTLGRLYYDKKDHKNLAMKMTAYFLEHVRTKYRLATHTLDDSFVQSLHFKSGYAGDEVRKIIHSINTIKEKAVISDGQLSEFHKQLEAFYQNT
ncbi:MAG TPA: DUF4350 domain-containing protein [Flavisolibacter sp.]|nr:DUF4350 domain-containing protein [Flavisolibacter sp.]